MDAIGPVVAAGATDACVGVVLRGVLILGVPVADAVDERGMRECSIREKGGGEE